MSKRSLGGDQAQCYHCGVHDKKGKLQRCLGWELVKRLEDDAKVYNQLQEAAQAQDDQLEAQKTGLAPPPEAETQDVDIVGEPSPAADLFDAQAAVDPSAGTQGVPQDGEGEEAHALAADAATNQHLTLREDPRFSLFSRKTTIFEHASCPYAPVPELPEGTAPGEVALGGLRYFHQTCLRRGEHLRHYRRVLHWSGSSNINPKKKVSGRRDMVKVTGRTALCQNCLEAFAHSIGADPAEVLPKETDPERRQRKVSSRRRLAHAREHPPLEHPLLDPPANCTHTVSICSGNRFKEQQSNSFAALRKAAPHISSACEALERAIRSYLTENAAELERRTKRQCTEFDIPLAMDEGPGCAPPAAHHPPGDGSHPHIAGESELHMGDGKFAQSLHHELLQEQTDGAAALDAAALQQDLPQPVHYDQGQPHDQQQQQL